MQVLGGQQTWICHEYIVSKETNTFQNGVTEFTCKMEAVGAMSPDFIVTYMTVSQG